MTVLVGDEDDSSFQVVGKKGRAIPRAARRTQKLPEAALQLPTPGARLRERHRAWPRSERPRLSVAPMMQWTDTHFRTLARLLSRRTLLFTEMIPAAAIVEAEAQGTLPEVLGFDASHRPIAVQIGGSSPSVVAKAAGLCARAGFDEVNLNVGCPSSKVTTGGYGACLMKNPGLVRDLASAAISACGEVPVTVKHRLGVDDHDSWEELVTFVETVASAGVRHFIVHARTALLGILSCEGNRTIPPLKYDWLTALIRRFPDLSFELNGGVASLDEAKRLLADSSLQGVMVGRAAYNHPWLLLAEADKELFGSDNPGLSRQQVFDRYLDYAASCFHARQRAGQAATAAAALELEKVLAAPLAQLLEDEFPGFGEALLGELEAASTASRQSAALPAFQLRSAASVVLAEAGAKQKPQAA
eukprot:TRINITY_DN34124_c0_g1_i1.p1 TRINITY_DN34124_c0_g1~~TRINITY_DN34124_c0_g1_i1.p1  ORF type:complete len:416 (-),score=101.53 TRINITY_DN34124_c0_g1_i1:48-1295(-)